MALFTLTIGCDNAAFDDEDFGPCRELARILEDLAANIVDLDGADLKKCCGNDGWPIFDADGHKVGRAKYTHGT
jgi:hypothetical protein